LVFYLSLEFIFSTEDSSAYKYSISIQRTQSSRNASQTHCFINLPNMSNTHLNPSQGNFATWNSLPDMEAGNGRLSGPGLSAQAIAQPANKNSRPPNNSSQVPTPGGMPLYVGSAEGTAWSSPFFYLNSHLPGCYLTFFVDLLHSTTK